METQDTWKKSRKARLKQDFNVMIPRSAFISQRVRSKETMETVEVRFNAFYNGVDWCSSSFLLLVASRVSALILRFLSYLWIIVHT